MSAPDVLVTSTSFAADEFGPGWTSYEAECGGCGQAFAHYVQPDVSEWAQRHENTCVPLKLARLQARWDARVEVLHTLIEQWRAEAETDRAAASAAGDLDLAMYAGGKAVAAMGHADELEAVIGMEKQ